MRYAFIFLTLGVCFIALAIQRGGWAWLLLWPGISSTLVGAGYARIGAGVFGKRSDGRYALWAIVIHLPYLLITLGACICCESRCARTPQTRSPPASGSRV